MKRIREFMNPDPERICVQEVIGGDKITPLLRSRQAASRPDDESGHPSGKVPILLFGEGLRGTPMREPIVFRRNLGNSANGSRARHLKPICLHTGAEDALHRVRQRSVNLTCFILEF